MNCKAQLIILETCRKVNPEIKIVFGGPEISREYVVDGNFDTSKMDYCISGEGERTFLELLNHLTTGNPEESTA